MRHSSEPLTIDIELQDGTRVVALAGELDIATAPIAEEALTAEIDVLDLSGLEFMDSSGLRVLVRLCSQRSEPLTVRGVQPNVRRLLDITEISDTLKFEDQPTGIE